MSIDSTSSTHSPHDSGYKLLFSHAQVVEDLLRGFVGEDWVEDLDFSTLEKVGGSYVTDDLRDREDDLIWRVMEAPMVQISRCHSARPREFILDDC